MVSKKAIVIMFIIALVLLVGSFWIAGSDNIGSSGGVIYEDFVDGDSDGNVNLVISNGDRNNGLEG